MADDIRLDSSYEDFLNQTQANLGTFSALSYTIDNCSAVTVKTNMDQSISDVDSIFYKYQGIARVDAGNFAKVQEDFRDLDTEIERQLSESGMYKEKDK